MNKKLSAEIRVLGGDPADEAWQWLLRNGPHGSAFTWSQTNNKPPGYVGVEHLQMIITEREERDASFLERARGVVRAALSSTDVDILRRAIQVAAIIGGEAELSQILALVTHHSQSVASNAKASSFYLKKRLPRSRGPGT
jgi:hypothetical protein